METIERENFAKFLSNNCVLYGQYMLSLSVPLLVYRSLYCVIYHLMVLIAEQPLMSDQKDIIINVLSF